MKQKNKHIQNFWKKDSIIYSEFDSKIFKKKIFSVTCKSLNKNILAKYIQKVEGNCFLNVKTLNFTNQIYSLKKPKINLEDVKFVFFFKKKIELKMTLRILISVPAGLVTSMKRIS